MASGPTSGPELAAPPAPRLFNVPNMLSFSRLGFGLLAFVLVELGMFSASFVVFVIAAGTDWFDGYLARRLGQTSAFGRQLDPLVDKLLIAGMFIFLLPIPGSGLAPWMVTVVVARELVIQWLRSLMEGRGVAFGANLAGKLKTMVQCLAIGSILVALAWLGPVPAWVLWTRDGLIWGAVILTILSGTNYLAGSLPRMLREGA